MPLDIASDVVFDPLLCERFDVIRRREAISAGGRSSVTPERFRNRVGVLTVARDLELMRQQFPEFQYATRFLSIVTNFRIQTATAGYQPDLVFWYNDDYVVVSVAPYPHFGRGFYAVICASVDQMDQGV